MSRSPRHTPTVPARRWVDGQQQLLELIARGAPLGHVLERLALEIEAQLPDSLCTILLLDEGGRLWSGAGPSVPFEFMEAINGVHIGPGVGTCGSAAFNREAVVTPNIATDPAWIPWREAALRLGLHSCWAVPIIGVSDVVLGTFAVYQRTIGEPTARHREVSDEASHIASIAIDRARAESTIRANESRLREITESINEMFYVDVLDQSGASSRQDYESAAFEAIWGRSRSEIASNPNVWMTSIHAEDLPRVQRAIAARAQGAKYDLQYRIVRPAGDVRWVHDRNVPVRNESGQVARFIGVVSDISERRQAELAFKQSEARLERIIGSAMDAIISVDEQQEIVIFNAAAERIFRTTAAEAIGTSVDRFVPMASRARHPGQMRTFAATGESGRTGEHPASVTGVRADGEEFPLEATISRAEVGGRQLLTVILRDMTEREQLETQYRQAQKMDAMGRLAGGVAHDFNNLLTAIRASAELLLSDLPDGQSRADAEEIRQAADRAASLTRQLLAFSRKQVLRPGVLDLNVVTGNIERLLRRVISEQIELQTVSSTEPAWVLADSSQMEQILVNLAVNARDAMPHGGTITIETTLTLAGELPPALVGFAARHGVEASTRMVVLSVRDNGTGMDEQVRTRAFEPFFTTKEPGRGTGLGLATVYGIVEQSGGAVAIESALRAGTTVWIALPHVPPSAEFPVPRPHVPATMRGRGTILIVEDEAAVRGIVKRVLTRAGYHTIEAAHAKEAIAIWKQANGASGGVDAVITDMIMPERTGRELVKELRESRPDLPVMFMSGYLEGGVTSSETGPNTAFIEKPFTTQHILEQLALLLGRSPDVSAPLTATATD